MKHNLFHVIVVNSNTCKVLRSTKLLRRCHVHLRNLPAAKAYWRVLDTSQTWVEMCPIISLVDTWQTSNTRGFMRPAFWLYFCLLYQLLLLIVLLSFSKSVYYILVWRLMLLGSIWNLACSHIWSIRAICYYWFRWSPCKNLVNGNSILFSQLPWTWSEFIQKLHCSPPSTLHPPHPFFFPLGE